MGCNKWEIELVCSKSYFSSWIIMSFYITCRDRFQGRWWLRCMWCLIEWFQAWNSLQCQRISTTPARKLLAPLTEDTNQENAHYLLVKWISKVIAIIMVIVDLLAGQSVVRIRLHAQSNLLAWETEGILFLVFAQYTNCQYRRMIAHKG